MTSSSRQGAIISLPVDFLLIGGLSIIHFALIMAFKEQISSNTLLWLASFAAPLTWVLNHPHFAATSWRLYRSREDQKQFPFTAYVLPVIMVALCGIALLHPEDFGPWYVKIYLLWSPYHFSAQTLGVTLLYARRTGFTFTGKQMRLLSWFIFATFIVPNLIAEFAPTGPRYYNIITPSFHLPAPMMAGYTLPQILQSGLFLMGLMVAVMLVKAAREQGRRLPPLMVCLLPATQLVWFVLGSGVTGFTEYVPAYHSLQYLLITWLLELRLRQTDRSAAPSRLFVVRSTLRWAAAIIAGGILLFWGLPQAAYHGLGVDIATSMALTSVAVQMHHFFVDGVIWKLKNPAVGSPLMTSLSSLTGRAPHVPTPA